DQEYRVPTVADRARCKSMLGRQITPMPSDPLAAYLPLLVRNRWASAGPPVGPREEQLEGAVLFVDLVGFTRLTDRYASRGAGGAEDLSRMLDACFGRLGTLGLERGGDVIYVAGDAMLLLWPAPAESLAIAVARAAAAGLAIQEYLVRTPLAGDEPLPVRASVGAGRLTALELGGIRDRWEFLLLGDPIQQIGLADRQGHSSQVAFCAVTPPG